MKGKLEEADPNSAPLLNEEDRDPYYDPEFSNSKSSRNWGRNHERYERCSSSAPNFSAAMGSVEIKGVEEQQLMDGEVQPGSAAICRICLEHDGDSGDELIAPCMCKGTQQFVHRSCLDHWRSVKEGFAFAHCTTCVAQFHLHINILEGSCWRNTKFRMFVARDILLVFLAVQTIIFTLGGLSYLCDLDGRFRKFIGHGWDHIFSNHPALFYYCLGAVIFFALLGIFGLMLECSSYSQNDSYGHSRSASAQTEPVYCCNGPCFIDFPSSSLDSADDCFVGVLVLVIVIIIAFAVIGIFYGFFAGSIGLQRIWQRHYHILTKRELTKEYEVEDLHGRYTPPKLDREHADRLRMLKLL